MKVVVSAVLLLSALVTKCEAYRHDQAKSQDYDLNGTSAHYSLKLIYIGVCIDLELAPEVGGLGRTKSLNGHGMCTGYSDRYCVNTAS